MSRKTTISRTMRGQKRRKAPAGGRPRVVSPEQIIDAALKVGFDNLTMKRVAEELGVTIPTIYNSVGNSAELLRKTVVQFIARLPFPADRGQHWSDYLREFARANHQMMTRDASGFATVLDCGYILESELQVLENFLGVMVPRGFEHDEALRIFRTISTAILGAVAATYRERITIKRSGSIDQAMHEALVHFPPDHLPMFRKTQINVLRSHGQLSEVIEPIIRVLMMERNEAVESPASS